MSRRTDAGRSVVAVLVIVLLIVGVGFVAVRYVTDRMVFFEKCAATAKGNTTTLGPSEAGYAATISGIAIQRQLPARAATIAIATAMQESKLRNITYGDRDSVGLFQQRPSQGWGTREQILDPVYASNAFYDVLIKFEGYQNKPITVIAQKVQRSAFPSAYAQHEGEARVFASALSGHSPAALVCELRPTDVPDETASGATGLTPRAQAVITALRRETNHGATAVPGSNGKAISVKLTGSEPNRFGWAVAQWAVARAGGLHIVGVQTDQRQWQRDNSKAGWTSGATTPSGEVTITVA